ncbi:MAG: hypothetical protein IJU57_07435 [Clostridia bacterium]|nr:hypothetical protein [Clostridia bacterium]
MNLLGVDFGTTSLKARLFDENGKVLCTESARYELITEGEYVEFPAERFFDLFLEVLDRISSSYRIDALSVDTQGETMIMLDKDGKPLMNAIIWLDNRASSQAKEIEERFTVRGIYELTGQAEIPAGYPAPKILWLRENRPGIFKRTAHYVLLEDYIVYRLTGRFAASRSLYSSSLLMNVRTGGYIPEMLDFLGIDESQLSVLCESGDLIGEYNGIKVSASALDQIAAVTGAGVVKKGLVCEMTGTSLAVSTLTDRFPDWHEGLTVSAFYVRRGLYCLLMWAPTAGAALEWFKSNFCAGMDYDEINELAGKASEGSDGVVCIPHLCGTVMPENEPDMRGVFFGLTLKHGLPQFIRAIMESVSYTIMEFLEYISSDAQEIRSLGGGSRSRLWCEIKSSVTGRKVVTLKETETACLGSAIFAGIGAGAYGSSASAAAVAVETDCVFERPQGNYPKLYREYREKEKLAKEIYKK